MIESFNNIRCIYITYTLSRKGVYMKQEEITILRVRKGTRSRLRKIALAKRESYDEIINRLLSNSIEQEESDESLESKKQKLLKLGISKELVDLLGIIPEISLEEEKSLIKHAIIRKMIG